MVEKTHTSGSWPSLYDPFRNMGSRLAEFLAPPSEASLADNVYRICVELPGVDEKDIEITCQDGVVMVKGEKATGREAAGDTWYFSERQYGSFSRSFRLPPDADDDKIGADLKDGVLTVVVPKAEPKEPAATRVKIKKS